MVSSITKLRKGLFPLLCSWVDLSHCDTYWTCLGQLCGYVEDSVAIQLTASEECLSLVSQDFNSVRGMPL